MLGKAVSTLQSNVAISDSKVVSGNLEYITDYTGFSSDPALQSGNFIALHWSNPEARVTSLKVGIVPSSIGADLVECINDTDRNGVFRVTDPATQKIRIVQSDGTTTRTDDYLLTNVVCETQGEG